MTALVCARPALSAALAERLGRPDDEAAVTLSGTDLRRLPIEQVRRAVVVSGAHAEAFAGPLAGRCSASRWSSLPSADWSSS